MNKAVRYYTRKRDKKAPGGYAYEFSHTDLHPAGLSEGAWIVRVKPGSTHYRKVDPDDSQMSVFLGLLHDYEDLLCSEMAKRAADIKNKGADPTPLEQTAFELYKAATGNERLEYWMASYADVARAATDAMKARAKSQKRRNRRDGV